MIKSFFKNSFSLLVAIFLLLSGFFITTGNVFARPSNSVLGVTQITAVKTLAAADGTYANGWSWVFDVTVPTNETILNMKFGDWVSGSNVITAGDHIRFYSAQSSNAYDSSSAITISSANAYGSSVMNLIPTSDLSENPGRQIQITVEVMVPAGSAGGSYSTGYGIQSNLDTIAPVITLIGENPQIIEGASEYTELGATAFDNVDGVVVVTPDASSVNTNIVGTYIVTYTATDFAATPNIATVTRTVNVVDTIDPVITAPEDQIIEATGPTTDPVLTLATATDTVDSNPVITYTPHSFSLGVTTVTWTATDASGNSSTTISTVTIVDTTNPTISGTPTDMTVEATSADGAVVTYISPTATDLVDGSVAVICTPVSGSTFPLGTTAVTCTATDLADNTDTTTFNVNVVDTPITHTWVSTDPTSDISVPLGTSLADAIISLGGTIGIIDQTAQPGTATVAWTITGYDSATPGLYTATGTLTLPAGWGGTPDSVTATVTVEITIL